MMKRARHIRATGFLIAGGLLLTACSATTSSVTRQPSATVAVQEAVGFTISEDVDATENDRVNYATAIQLLENGDLDRGITELERFLQSVPNATAARIDLGIAYHQKGDLDSAEQHLIKALELNPAHPVALNELGFILRETGRFEQARRRYEQAIAVYPGYHHARRNLGILCDLYLGDRGCAIENYQAYLSSVPSDPEVEMWVTDLQQRSGRE